MVEKKKIRIFAVPYNSKTELVERAVNSELSESIYEFYGCDNSFAHGRTVWTHLYNLTNKSTILRKIKRMLEKQLLQKKGKGKDTEYFRNDIEQYLSKPPHESIA